MRNIIIVQCMSTGKNYVQDIIDRNCNPVVLEMNPFGDSEDALAYQEEVKAEYELIENDFDLIYEKDTYEETLEMVREFDPLIIVPGTEDGVILATRLANDLDLLCNPIENIDALTLKDEMQNRLAENGLRSIKGKVVRSVDEAIEYYDAEGLDGVVVKPVYSAASVGVRLCSNRHEMIEAVKEVFNLTGVYGNELNELVIQERINGQEYVVDTVSCNGIHRVTMIWKYNKIETAEGGNIYDYDETVNELGIGESELVEYAYDVADALGVKYGPVHGEYMVDENGPVLIEVNCRPHGGSLDRKFMDFISGQHETDSALDSYLNPEKFNLERMKGYHLFAQGVVKSFIVPKDLIAKSSPMNSIGVNLKSFFKTDLNPIESPKTFSKTQDLETDGGTVYLAHEDPNQLQRDIDFIRDLEKRAFQLVLSEELRDDVVIDDNEISKGIESLMNEIKAYGTSLLVTENVFDNLNVSQVSIDDLNEIKGTFDCVVINLNKSLSDMNADEIAKRFLDIFDKVKFGGLIFIPKTTYDFMPNSRLGAEALLKVLDFKIELPIHKLNRMVIASKR
ncbi:MAG: ATP-grasp domain-containing protein [Methanobrevibacter sp.]|uniref:ATP-grasp domain-containing protein n=1 Tax=Methanobrevibacter sp. TaxID=66852 RepID=UPI0025DF4AE8|nr:ATP-grasp domain-containing protein [Methanobrevibacter sp.]MBQ6098931.1 ATP-grasp domain-containing protein [Methanobrevibacter sp.]